MPALTAPPTAGRAADVGGATAWPSASSAPRPRTGPRRCTAGSTLARDDRPRLARPRSPGRPVRARGQVLAHLSLRYRQLTSVRRDLSLPNTETNGMYVPQ